MQNFKFKKIPVQSERCKQQARDNLTTAFNSDNNKTSDRKVNSCDSAEQVCN